MYPVSDGGRRGQSCIFFESVLAKKVRTDPDAAVTDPLRLDLEMKLQICRTEYSLGFAGTQSTAGQAKRAR